jgi:hypothetical protein
MAFALSEGFRRLASRFASLADRKAEQGAQTRQPFQVAMIADPCVAPRRIFAEIEALDVALARRDCRSCLHPAADADRRGPRIMAASCGKRPG